MSQSAHNARSLAEVNVGLVARWAGFYKRRDAFKDIDADDIAQEGYLGLIRASQLYDPRRNCRFSTYAARWIRYYIGRLGKREKTNPDKPCDPYQLDALTVPDKDAAALDGAIASETQNALSASLGTLDIRSRDVIMSRFGIDRKRETLREIGLRHGITRARVQQIERTAIKKLHKNINLNSFNDYG